jgi:HlyD family secretion protein
MNTFMRQKAATVLGTGFADFVSDNRSPLYYMDREIPKEVKLRARRLSWIKAGTGILVGVLAVWGIISLLQSGVNRKDLQFSVVDKGAIELSVNATGQVVPAFEEIINSPINSRIMEVYKKGGDAVSVGDPILRLDLQSTETEYGKLLDEEKMRELQLNQLRLTVRSRLSEMEMKLKVSRMELDRKAVELRNEQYLDSLGAGTADKVREVELAYNVGRLQLDEDEQKYINEKELSEADIKVKELELNIFRKGLAESRRTLEDARIRSPRSATLTFVNNEVGAQVAAGSRIAVVSDLSRFKIEGEIADVYGDRIAPGSKALVRIGNSRLDGTVSDVTPLSRNGVISFTVQLAEADNSRLRSGLKADVYIMYAVNEEALRIANSPSYRGRGEYNVFVVEGNELKRQKVTLGDSNYDFVEVISGLKEGDEVVTSDMENYISKDKLRLNQ